MMQLYLNGTSPYARVVRVVLIETAQIEQTKLIWCDPWTNNTPLLDASPLSRIPVLITEDGQKLTESLLICHYLCQRGQSTELLSANQSSVYHLLGIAQGLMDAAFNTVISRKYLVVNKQDTVLDKRRLEVIHRTLKSLENEKPSSEIFSLGELALVVALDYIHFRLPEVAIAKRYARLEQWRVQVASRPSFVETAFV